MYSTNSKFFVVLRALSDNIPIVKHKVRAYANQHATGKLPRVKVAVCGAAGRVGQPLCLLLKQSPYIQHLSLYDLKNTTAFGMELSHVDTNCLVAAYSGHHLINEALNGANIVVIVAKNIDCKSSNYKDMFNANAMIICSLMSAIVDTCPKALIAIGTNPINSLIPVASEVMRQNGVHNPNKIFGITSLDIVRANTLAAKVLNIEPECVEVPVIGGYSRETVVPLFSKTKPHASFETKVIAKITADIQKGHPSRAGLDDQEVGGSSHLAAAFSIARFVISLARGITEQEEVSECAYTRSSLYDDCKYLSTPLQIGPSGIEKYLEIPRMSDYEAKLFQKAVSQLQKDIQLGEMYMGSDVLTDNSETLFSDNTRFIFKD